MKKFIAFLSAFVLFISLGVMGIFLPQTTASADEKTKTDILYLQYYIDEASSPKGYSFYIYGDWTLKDPQGEYNKFAAGITVNGEKDGEAVSYTSDRNNFNILDGYDLYFQNMIRIFLPSGTKTAPDDEGIMTPGMFDRITSITIEAGFSIRTCDSETRTTKTFVPKAGYIDENTPDKTMLVSNETCTIDEDSPELEMGFLAGINYSTAWEYSQHHYLFEINFPETGEFAFQYQLGIASVGIPRGSVIINGNIDICDIDALFMSSEPYREYCIALYIYPNQTESQKYDLSKIESIEFKAGFNLMTDNWRNFREGELKKDYKYVAMSTFDTTTEYSVPFYSDTGMCPVVFYGANDVVLEVQNVKKGEAAVAPQAPELDGYQFVGWDKSFDSILGVTHVYAVYEPLSDEINEQTGITLGCGSTIGSTLGILPLLAGVSMLFVKKPNDEEV